MNEQTCAILFVLATWWLGTAIVLKTVWLARSMRRLSVLIATILMACGFVGLYKSSTIQSTTASYVSFASALAVWAWHELTFLLGVVTGPRKVACPPDAQGWRRFRYATATVIDHELALVITMLAIFALTFGKPNQAGTWTFFVLWIMRLSAKLNIFLGVRNITEQFVPAHLRYLLSYFRRARINALMPLSLIGASIFGAWIATVGAASSGVVGRTLVATMLALAVIEHLFLALPVPDAALWRWAIRKESA